MFHKKYFKTFQIIRINFVSFTQEEVRNASNLRSKTKIVLPPETGFTHLVRGRPID